MGLFNRTLQWLNRAFPPQGQIPNINDLLEKVQPVVDAFGSELVGLVATDTTFAASSPFGFIGNTPAGITRLIIAADASSSDAVQRQCSLVIVANQNSVETAIASQQNQTANRLALPRAIYVPEAWDFGVRMDAITAGAQIRLKCVRIDLAPGEYRQIR